MAVYADSTRCPDCRTTLPPAPGSCPACSLPLTGPVVDELFATLQHADHLLRRVRASAPVSAAHPGRPAGSPSGGPSGRPVGRPAGQARPGLGAPSVPVILLGLGAICLLVAAVTFLAFAWSWLGVGGRTAVLVALTAAAGAGAEVLRRRDLRIAGEAVALVALGLLVLDVFGAGDAGWLGDLGAPGLLATLGLTLAVPSLAWTVAARWGRSAPLATPQAATVVGLSLVVAGWVARSGEGYAGAAIGAALLLALAVAARRLDVPFLAVLAATTAFLWWLPLALAGLARAVDHATLDELVGRADAWPLVVAAGLLVAATWAVRTSATAVVGGLGGAAALLTALPVVVAADNRGADLAWVLVVAAVVWSVALVRLPASFALGATIPLGVTALGALLLAGLLVVEALSAVSALVEAPWTRAWSVRVGRVADLDPTRTPAVMLAGLVAGLVVAALATRLTLRGPLPSWRAALLRAGGGALVIGAVVVASHQPPLATVLALLLVAGVGLVAVGLHDQGHRDGTRSGPAEVVAGSVTLAVAVLVSLASVGLTAVVTTAVLAVAGVVARRSSREDLRGAALVAAPVLAGLAGWTAGDLAGLPDAWRAAPVVLVLGLGIIRSPRIEVELAALPTATATALASVSAAGTPADALAAYLTLGGALLVASAVVNDGRRILAWAGGALLAGATWVRLYDAGVTIPEAYTMPTALALLVVGLVRLARDRDADTWSTISAGLVLATLPSLATLMGDEPATLRALLLGLGCLGLVLAGAAARWSAPLLVGAGVGVVLVLREWGPYAATVPPWAVIGVAGSLLLVVGVTWEARLVELRRGAAYLSRLR